MGTFLHFILFIFIIALFFIGSFIYRIYKQINKVKKQFGNFTGQNNGANHAAGQDSRTYGDEEIIIDKRNPDKSSQKIFTEDDGEYVDYEETKDHQ